MASQFVARPRFLRSYKEIPLFDGCFEQIEKQNLNLETFVLPPGPMLITRLEI